MKRFLVALLLLGTTGFGLGQVTRVHADLYTGMSCAAFTEQWGYSDKDSMAYTADWQGWCYSYYLTSSYVYNGTPYTWPYGGWDSSPRYWIQGQMSSVFSTHNVYRDWYYGYVGTSDY
jgi:hypothetical protein